MLKKTFLIWIWLCVLSGTAYAQDLLAVCPTTEPAALCQVDTGATRGVVRKYGYG